MQLKRFVMTMLGDDGQNVVFAVRAQDEQHAVDQANEKYPEHVLIHYKEGKSNG